MIEAVFRLESFSAALPESLDLMHRDEVASAYRHGLAEGRAMGFSAELRALTEAIQALGATMADVAAIRAEAEQQTVAGIGPILAEIVTALASRAEAAGLETALGEELARLVGQPAPSSWHILCPPGMEAMIRRCAETAGIRQPDIRVDAAAAEASVILGEGRSAFSGQPVVERFRALIFELQEGHR